ANKGRVQFVVVFNLTRFAREKYDHFALRARPKSLGISLRSATEPIDDTSTGKLMEGVTPRLRAVRQRCAVRPDARRHARGARTRTLDVPRAARLHERAPRHRQKSDA